MPPTTGIKDKETVIQVGMTPLPTTPQDTERGFMKGSPNAGTMTPTTETSTMTGTTIMGTGLKSME